MVSKNVGVTASKEGEANISQSVKEIRLDLVAFSAKLEFFEGISQARDDLIKSARAVIKEAVDREVPSERMNKDLRKVLSEAAKRTREGSPSDALILLDEYASRFAEPGVWKVGGVEVWRSSGAAPSFVPVSGTKEENNKNFENYVDIVNKKYGIEQDIDILRKKHKVQQYSYLVKHYRGTFRYEVVEERAFGDLEEFAKPEKAEALNWVIDLVALHDEILKVQRGVKVLLARGEGRGKVAEYLENYDATKTQGVSSGQMQGTQQVRPEPGTETSAEKEATAPPQGMGEETRRPRRRKHVGEHITMGYTSTLNSYAEENGYKEELVKANPQLAERLDEAVKARRALSDKDAIELYQFLALAWSARIAPYIKDSGFADHLRVSIANEITNMSGIDQINILAKKLMVIYGTLFTEAQLAEMGMKERHLEKLRMTVGDMSVTENFWDGNTTWYEIYRIFDKAWRDRTMPPITAAERGTTIAPPPPPVFVKTGTAERGGTIEESTRPQPPPSSVPGYG